MSISHVTPGPVGKARPPGADPAGTETTVAEDEAIHKRGLLLSVMQAVALVVGFALLLAVAAPGIFATLVSIAACLVIFGSLHYWLWGRWMSRR